MNRGVRLIVVGMLAACILGCGDGRPTRVPVAGRVLIDGKPLTRGTVKFVSTTGRPAVGELDSDGKFRLSCYEPYDGCIPGAYKVSVTSGLAVGNDATRWFAPKKYSDYRTSGLTQDIAGPTEDVAINISWEGGREFVEREQASSGGEEGMAGRRTKKKAAE